MSKEQKLNYLAIAELELAGKLEPTQQEIEAKEVELAAQLEINV